MKLEPPFSWVAPLCASLVLTACGGGGDDAATRQLQMAQVAAAIQASTPPATPATPEPAPEPAPPAAPEPVPEIDRLRLLGSTSLPTGTLFEGVEFGGISGLDLAADGSYWAIADDRGGERGTPRFYNLGIDYDVSGNVSVKINRQIFMLREDGMPFPADARTVDPEALRVAPNGNLYWSSEGNWNSNAASLFQPFLREMKTDGSFVRQFDTPPIYNYVDNATQGGRNNKLFEALAVTPGGRIFIGNEDALAPDGPLTTVSNGSVLRITEMDPATGQAKGQYAYELPHIRIDAPAAARFPPDSGLSDMLAVSDTQFIAVERAFADTVGNTIRLVLTDIGPDTTDVSALPSLVGQSYTPMRKQVLLDMLIYQENVKLDNMEALSWGKRLPNGNRTLILAADNNFTANIQSTLFMVFEVIDKSPAPAAPAG